MPEKSFLEILSERIERQILSDLSKAGFSTHKPSNNQSMNQTLNEKSSQNVDNSLGSEDIGSSKSGSTAHPSQQWINQIPLGKIHFSTPKKQVFGRVYPINAVRPQVEPPRQRHALTEVQKQAVVYFWGWQIRLQEDFTLSELKKAFRALAHRLHPDRNNGKTKAFIELKAHYQCLLSVF